MTDYILIALAALLLVGEILLFVTRPKKTDDTAALRETERRLQDELSRRQSETDAALRSLQTQLGDMKSALLQQQTQQQEQLYRTLAHQTEKMTVTLTEAFRKEFGITIMQYLNELRMEQAERLLCESNAPVSQIAEHCGFADAGYFTRRFTAKHGLSPSAFRLQRQGMADNPSR